MTFTARPPAPPPAHDLTDAEFAELDELLAATPEPLEALDAVMLDGYLCGVIVQPVLLEAGTWLPHVFDFDARPLPDGTDPGWLERVTALIRRRHAVLNRALAEEAGFDPLILEPEESDQEQDSGPGPEADAAPQAADADPIGADDDVDTDPGFGLSKISTAVMPWVAGFQHACAAFPDLDEMEDDSVDATLARLYRHLPAESDEERELVETLDREYPLDSLDEAIDDLVAAVADLYDLTREQRYKVETVRREMPKVGRNDPCPCGSGRKFKQCHGAAG